MEERELNNILQELYQLDAGLQDHENILKEVIRQMSDLRPDTPFTPALAAKIKQEVMNRLNDRANSPKKAFSFSFVYWQKYLYVGSALVFVLFLVLVIYRLPSFKKFNTDLNNIELAQNNDEATFKDGELDNSAAGVVKLASKAFGSLSGEAQVIEDQTFIVNDTESVIPVTGSESRTMAPAIGLGDGGDSASSMIAPLYQVKYVYTGEQLSLEEESGAVYKHLTNDLMTNDSLLSLVKSLDFKDFDIRSFNNLKVTHLSLVEDKDRGLALNIDFLSNNIDISENWNKWQNAEREACGVDNACWEKFRTKISDIPSDKELIAISDKFISDHNISLDHYGEAKVDNNWKTGYERYTNSAITFAPDYVSVVYPLLIENAPVLDQSGNFYGLRVNVRVLQKAASGLNGLSPYRYQSSNYPLETDFERIIKVAEAGRQTGIYYEDMERGEVQEIELGSPSRAYVQYWHYSDKGSEELFVPAMVFPVITINESSYYGQHSVVVPLVKELLEEKENMLRPGNMEIMPIVR